MRRTQHRPRPYAYTLTHAKPATWTLRYGRRVRCTWSGPWPSRTMLDIVAHAVAAETGTAVRWRRLSVTPGRTLFVALRHRAR
jgi:hypothetical protein